MNTFPPFTGHGPCPKCGSPKYQTLYHEQGWLEVGAACWDLPDWPQDGGGGDPLSLEEETMGTEEHLHRKCPVCGYETVEALASHEQRQPRAHRYELMTGIEQVHAKAEEGWTVVAAWGMGVQMGAVMEAPE